MLIRDSQTVQTFYAALVARDSRFVGQFFVGVKTTKICCIATCRARKPKFENVEFFSALKPALEAGYRPCKICRPAESAHAAPSYVEKAIALVRDYPKQRINDAQLREQGISPETLRRWFKLHYGMTYHTYQRMYRINHALEELKCGRRSTDAALDAGYDSLSGFGYTFKKLTGSPPSAADQCGVILLDRTTSPIGPMFICATARGICLLEFVDRRMLETEFRDLQKRLNARIIAGNNAHTRQLKAELAEYFAGTRKTFNVALHTPGTEFQQRVWRELQTIPYAETRSYAQQAVSVGNPAAVRAVASANGHNRVAIVIPCHRVIGSNGQLTGYGGGLSRKRWLLEHESAHASA